MNLLFVCSAKSWGGNEKWTSMAMQALAKNHKVFFIGKAPHLLEKFGTHAGSTTMAFSSYVDVFTYKKLDSFITKNQIELIVSTKKIEYFLCGLLAKKHGIKHLMRLGVNRKMNIPFWHKLTYFKLNDGLIVNSHFIKQDLCKTSYFDPKRIHVLYNGIPGFYSNSRPSENSNPNAKFVIVSSGRMTTQKGYGLLIDAINQLSAETKEQLEVRIIGEGRNKKDFEIKTLKLGLQNTIFFTGFVNNPLELMLDANLFVLLSEREGISNSLLEAMTHSIPILTTNTGGIGEIITDEISGFETARSVSAVATKIEQLIHSREELKRVGQQGFSVIQSKFGFDVFEKNITSLFNTFKKGSEEA